MKRKTSLLLLIILATFSVQAQVKERFALFTDRDVYVSGETLLIKLMASLADTAGIVHVDLISHDGKRITGLTQQLIDKQANGVVFLPDSLRSGCYFLRASGRTSPWLTYKEIYIANKFNGLPESNKDDRPTGIQSMGESDHPAISVDGMESSYHTRGKVKVTLHMQAELKSQIAGNLLVTVAEASPEFTTSSFVTKSMSRPGPSINPEGIIIEGLVTDLKTSLPFVHAIVNLSIPDSIPEYKYFITGEDGRFYFQIRDYFGKIPVVIQCYSEDKSKLLKIKLDEQESIEVQMPDFEAKSFPEGMKRFIEKSKEAVTYQKIFNQFMVTIQPSSKPIKNNVYPFYGVPIKTVDPKLFIDLPDFAEISKELLPGVKFRATNRIPTLQILNISRQSYFEDTPLLLINGIPVRDLNLIRDLGSKELDKIEICQSDRYYGDMKFPGVLALYTTKRDLSRIRESDDLIILDQDVFQPQSKFDPLPVIKNSDPDFRQVLLWNTAVQAEETIPVEFLTSDIQGVFKIRISGRTKDGSIFYKEQNFEVH